MAWIICTMYDRGRIAEVENPQDIPAEVKDGIWTDGVEVDEFGRRAVKGSEPVKVSHAREIPRKWRGEVPGFRGSVVRYDAESGYFVTVEP